MKTWREIRESLRRENFSLFGLNSYVPDGQVETQTGSQESEAKKADKSEIQNRASHSSGIHLAKKADKADPLLEDRLTHHGISIAIDRATSSAFLVFTTSDADAVRNVAGDRQPFEVTLTASQTAEVAKDLDYYERVLEKQEERRAIQDERRDAADHGHPALDSRIGTVQDASDIGSAA